MEDEAKNEEETIDEKKTDSQRQDHQQQEAEDNDRSASSESHSSQNTSASASDQPPFVVCRTKRGSRRRKPAVKRGRVTKRRAPPRRSRKAPARTPCRGRAPAGLSNRRRTRRPARSASTETTFTKITSDSESDRDHDRDRDGKRKMCRQCNNRRLTERERKKIVEMVIKEIQHRERRGLLLFRKTAPITVQNAGNQQGSKAKMLSPLCIETHAMNQDCPDEPSYVKVTPEMIYKALRQLSSGYPRDMVPFTKLLEYIMTNWPVNQNVQELTQELQDKLRIAQLIEMVEMINVMDSARERVPHWRLRGPLLKRLDTELSKTHVTKFWTAYGDTMKPARKRELVMDQMYDLNLDPIKKRRTSHESGQPCCSRTLNLKK